MVLFSNILGVISLAVPVDALPLYSNLSPHVATRTMCVSTLLGCKLATNQTYDYFFSVGIAVCLTKNIVLVIFGV